MIPLGCVQSSGGGGPGVYTIVVTDGQNINLLDLFELEYGTPILGDAITFEVDMGVLTGSVGAGTPSLRTGVWPVGVIPTLIHSTVTRGAGGNGTGPSTGQDGGTAFLAESLINVDNALGTFAGGGGGGAGTDDWPGVMFPGNTYASGGGGGAGSVPGAGGTATGATNQSNGISGTTSAGGAGGNFGSDPNQNTLALAGSGGALGMPGNDANDHTQPGSEDNVGGDAGYAVEGYSLVTWINVGTIIGPTTG